MIHIVFFLFFCGLLSACGPISTKKEENQFSVSNGVIFFDGHDLGRWSIKTIPYCKYCSFNIHTKKLRSGAMLFKEINNERGDLVVLSATSIRQPFALQAGGASYSIGINLNDEAVRLSSDFQNEIFLQVKQVEKLHFGLQNYFVSLQDIDSNKATVDLIFWLDQSIE